MRPCVRAAALLARDPAHDHALRELQQEAELERLRQVAVEQRRPCPRRRRCGSARGVRRRSRPGGASGPRAGRRRSSRASSVASSSRIFHGRSPSCSAEQLAQLAVGVGHDAVGNGDRRVRERPLGRVPPRALAVRDRLHQRVAAEAVRAVHRHARSLAGAVQAFERREAPDVGVDATHVVVGTRPNGDRLVDRVDARERLRELTRAVQPLDDLLRAEVAQVEQDVAVDAAALVDLGLLGARDDVARRELHRVRRVALQEALALGVQR